MAKKNKEVNADGETVSTALNYEIVDEPPQIRRGKTSKWIAVLADLPKGKTAKFTFPKVFGAPAAAQAIKKLVSAPELGIKGDFKLQTRANGEGSDLYVTKS